MMSAFRKRNLPLQPKRMKRVSGEAGMRVANGDETTVAC